MIFNTVTNTLYPESLELWKQHLDGTNSLGVIPINEDNKCKWD
jgi:hypothetical protein